MKEISNYTRVAAEGGLKFQVILLIYKIQTKNLKLM